MDEKSNQNDTYDEASPALKKPGLGLTSNKKEAEKEESKEESKEPISPAYKPYQGDLFEVCAEFDLHSVMGQT